MSSYNKVLLMGNLTRSPELRYLPSGTPVCEFGLAMNHTWKTESGEKREEATFVDVTVFGKQAETVSKHFGKGRPIFIEGRLKFEQWDDKQSGQKRSKLGVLMESFRFIESKKSETPETSEPAPF